MKEEKAEAERLVEQMRLDEEARVKEEKAEARRKREETTKAMEADREEVLSRVCWRVCLVLAFVCCLPASSS